MRTRGNEVPSRCRKGTGSRPPCYHHPWIDRESPVLLADYVTLEAGHRPGAHRPGPRPGGLRLRPQVPPGPAPAGGRRRALHRRRSRSSPARTSSTPTPAVIELLQARAARCCTRRASPTATPTAGAPRSPSSSGPRNSGSSPWTTNGLRSKALAAIEKVTWIPPWGRNRIYEMVERRARLVHLPPAVLGHAHHRLPLRGVRRGAADSGDLGGQAARARQEGTDAWFDASRLRTCCRRAPAAPAAPPTSTRRPTSWTSGSTPGVSSGRGAANRTPP